jgi:ribosomal RNA-processing protein 8
MFAVPGWSVAAGSLKAETAINGKGTAQPPKATKRKRGNVDDSNVGDLWNSIVDGKPAGKPAGNDASKKRQRTRDNRDEKSAPVQANDESGQRTKDTRRGEEKVEKVERKKKNKKDKKHNKSNSDEKPAEEDLEPLKESTAPADPPAPSAPAPSKLTPLQASMRQKLISARFRHLNETLYTRPSDEAFGLFQESPEMFEEYHEGFRQQVKVWPENPVESFLKDIRVRAKNRTPHREERGAPPSQLIKAPLPRTAGTCTIADLGCGDAQLSKSLQSEKARLRVQVNSYDLQSPDPIITKADIANLPLEDGSINVAIFCLALMGTNWMDFIDEAYRVLHWRGELWIAEIKSRFGPVKGKNSRVTHSVGARSKKAAAGKKNKGGDEPSEAHDDDLAVEVDGADDRRRETDVSVFVQALKSRGFVLAHEKHREAIDLTNKMFVKMHFIKGAPAIKGKNVKPQDAAKGEKGDKRKTFEQYAKSAENDATLDESSILKPCVYKIR